MILDPVAMVLLGAGKIVHNYQDNAHGNHIATGSKYGVAKLDQSLLSFPLLLVLSSFLFLILLH